jgi:hypothetical protein
MRCAAVLDPLRIAHQQFVGATGLDLSLELSLRNVLVSLRKSHQSLDLTTASFASSAKQCRWTMLTLILL